MKLKSNKLFKAVSVFLCFLLCFQQTGFAQVATGELNIAGRLASLRNALISETFRPLHLRYLSFNPLDNNFKLLLDKGTLKEPSNQEIEDTSKTLMQYFLIGLTLPNETFWVNLRPDSPEQIIDDKLAQTDIGRIMLETDLQLKKDTAKATSPETPEGKEYWEKLYKKAAELFGTENMTIPTLTRPWIVPGEVIIRETADSAYIYKATLKVMLEQDYLKNSPHAINVGAVDYSFKDERLKILNEYSTQLIKELIIPKLTREVNSSKRYASLRQVYYSLIMAQWFKSRFKGKQGDYYRRIDRHDLNDLTSKESWSKDTYFNAYKKSFKEGEYNLREPVYTPTGQVIRSYVSGGIKTAIPVDKMIVFPGKNSGVPLLNGNVVGTEYLLETIMSASKEATLVPNVMGKRLAGSSLEQKEPVAINAQARVALNYRMSFLKARFKILGNNDAEYKEIKATFDSLIRTLKEKKKTEEDKQYYLVVYDAHEVNASYMVGTNAIFLSFGLLDALDKYLKKQGIRGVALDHVAAILGHELQHSLQDFNASGQGIIAERGDQRKKEYDADIQSLLLLDSAGYNPKALLDVKDFLIHADKNKDSFLGIRAFLSTHPDTGDRRKTISKIIEDKNTLFFNTKAAYRFFKVHPRKSFLELLGEISSPEEFIGLPGEVSNNLAFLIALRQGGGGREYSAKYGFSEESLRRFTNEQHMRPALLNLLRSEITGFTDAQIEVLYELRLGFLFEQEGKIIDKYRKGNTVYPNRFQLNETVLRVWLDHLNTLIKKLSPQEKKAVYGYLTLNPPVFLCDESDIFPQVRTELNRLYTVFYEAYASVIHLFIRNADKLFDPQALRNEDILHGIRLSIEAFRRYYRMDLLQATAFPYIVFAFLKINIMHKADFDSLISLIMSEFSQPEDIIREDFCLEVGRELIKNNVEFHELTLERQLYYLNRLMPEKSLRKNELLRLFWDKVKTSEIKDESEYRNILESMLLAIDLNNVDNDEVLFFDESEVYWASGIVTTGKRYKSLYAELSHELAVRFFRITSVPAIQALEEMKRLLKKGVLLDYQDFMRYCLWALEGSSAESYLEIAREIKGFIERNALLNSALMHASDYHDIFILAYFFKTSGIPFVFFHSAEDRDIGGRFTDEKEMTVVRSREFNSTYFKQLPLFLEIINTSSSTRDEHPKIMVRNGHHLAHEHYVGDGVARDGLSVNYREIFNYIMTQNRTKLNIHHLKWLRDHCMNKNMLQEWMSLLYPHASISGDESLEIIEYLIYPENDSDENVTILGERIHNPFSLVNCVRAIAFDQMRFTDSLANSRAMDIAFRLRGRKTYHISTLQELDEAMKEVEKYFPRDSVLRNKEIEKIFVSFLSVVTRHPYTVDSIRFQYKTGGITHTFEYEGYNLPAKAKDFIPGEDEAHTILQAFEKVAGKLSRLQRSELGKIIYAMIQNNVQLSYFFTPEKNLELLNMLFSSYSQAKDDFIYDLLERFNVTGDFYEKAIVDTTTFAYQNGEESNNREFAALELARMFMRLLDSGGRKAMLLWLMSRDEADKPQVIRQHEERNNVHFNELPDFFWNMTDSERTDFLFECLAGEQGLFNIDYEGMRKYVTAQNIRRELEGDIQKRYALERLMQTSRLAYGTTFFEAMPMPGIPRKSATNIREEWEKSLEKGKVDLSKIVSDLFIEFCVMKQGVWEEHVRNLSEFIDAISEGIASIEGIEDAGTDRGKEKRRIIKARLLYAVLPGYRYYREGRQDDYIDSKRLRERMFATIEDLIKDITADRVDFDAAYQYYGGIRPTQETGNTKAQAYLKDVFPLIERLAEAGVHRNLKIHEELEGFFVSSIHPELKKMQVEKKAEALEEMERVFASLSSDMPEVARLRGLMREYSTYKTSGLDRCAEFEEFISALFERKIAPLFQKDELQAAEGLIKRRFVHLSLERKVEFLISLFRTLNKDIVSKGDMLVAFAESGGVPYIKLFQLLAQREMFVALEDNIEEGRALNRRISEVKSHVDRLRKATIISVLKSENLLQIVDSIGTYEGAASITQTNRVLLRDQVVIDGKGYRVVAFKMVRPSALKHLDEDLLLLEKELAYFNQLYPELNISLRLIDKIKVQIAEELDLARTIAANRRFKSNLKKRNSSIALPEIVYQNEGDKKENLVFIMEEFIEGKALGELSVQSVANEVYVKILDEFLQEVFIDGFYHADLHDRNIIIKPDGTVAFIDLGGYGEVKMWKRKPLLKMFEQMSKNDTKGFLKSIRRLGIMHDFEKEIYDIFLNSKDAEERFTRLFSLFSQHEEAMDQWLFIFFQAMSKVGKYFDQIQPKQKAQLFLKLHSSVARVVFSIASGLSDYFKKTFDQGNKLSPGSSALGVKSASFSPDALPDSNQSKPKDKLPAEAVSIPEDDSSEQSANSPFVNKEDIDRVLKIIKNVGYSEEWAKKYFTQIKGWIRENPSKFTVDWFNDFIRYGSLAIKASPGIFNFDEVADTVTKIGTLSQELLEEVKRAADEDNFINFIYLVHYGFTPDVNRKDVVLYHGSSEEQIRDMIFGSSEYFDEPEGRRGFLHWDYYLAPESNTNNFSFSYEVASGFADVRKPFTVLQFNSKALVDAGFHLEFGNWQEQEIHASRPVPLRLLTAQSRQQLAERFYDKELPEQNKILTESLGFDSLKALEDFMAGSSLIQEDAPALLKPQTSSPLGSIDSSSRSPSFPIKNKLGGIDFRSLPIVTKAVANLSVHISISALNSLRSVNLDEEWQSIEKLASSGLKPSAERIKEYAQASSAVGKISMDKEKIIVCISDIFRQEEESCCESDPVLRDILVVLESVQQPQELKEVFLGKVS